MCTLRNIHILCNISSFFNIPTLYTISSAAFKIRFLYSSMVCSINYTLQCLHRLQYLFSNIIVINIFLISAMSAISILSTKIFIVGYVYVTVFLYRGNTLTSTMSLSCKTRLSFCLINMTSTVSQLINSTRRSCSRGSTTLTDLFPTPHTRHKLVDALLRCICTQGRNLTKVTMVIALSMIVLPIKNCLLRV